MGGALGLLFLLLGGLILFVIGLRVGLPGGRQTVEIHARMAENGGWTPGDLTIRAGEPLHLRLVSDDVVHSFAIGQSGQPPVDLMPGKPVETTLIFDTPGKYTYYCTRWCGINHWRMRGTIQVLPREGATALPAVTAQPPLYVVLGLDIDAAHLADVDSGEEALGSPRRKPGRSYPGPVSPGRIIFVPTARPRYGSRCGRNHRCRVWMMDRFGIWQRACGNRERPQSAWPPGRSCTQATAPPATARPARAMA